MYFSSYCLLIFVFFHRMAANGVDRMYLCICQIVLTSLSFWLAPAPRQDWCPFMPPSLFELYQRAALKMCRLIGRYILNVAISFKAIYTSYYLFQSSPRLEKMFVCFFSYFLIFWSFLMFLNIISTFSISSLRWEKLKEAYYC